MTITTSTDDDLIWRGSVLERLELAEHDAEERDWRSGAHEIARLRKYVEAIPAVQPAPVAVEPHTRTGIFDREGREICAGDRIRINLEGPATKREYWCPEYVVVWKAPAFVLEHAGGDKDSDTAHWYFRVPQKTSTAKIEAVSIAAVTAHTVAEVQDEAREALEAQIAALTAKLAAAEARERGLLDANEVNRKALIAHNAATDVRVRAAEAKVERLVEALQGLLLAVDTYADTAPQSGAEIAASGDVSLAAEAARAVLAEMENRHG